MTGKNLIRLSPDDDLSSPARPARAERGAMRTKNRKTVNRPPEGRNHKRPPDRVDGVEGPAVYLQNIIIENKDTEADTLGSQVSGPKSQVKKE